MNELPKYREALALKKAASPLPWGMGQGWEQTKPGTYIHSVSGVGGIVYAPDDDADKSCGEQISEQQRVLRAGYQEEADAEEWE